MKSDKLIDVRVLQTSMQANFVDIQLIKESLVNMRDKTMACAAILGQHF